jgi:signal transduction histidine kinase
VPKFVEFKIQKLFDQIHTLMREELESHHIKLKHDVITDNMTLFADEKLIEQVIINLLKNAIHALEGNKEPVIQLSALQEDDTSLLYVKDNGNGISDEIIDQVFTPFFTTREGGSGIGLSLSRQIMRMHKGSIGIQSEEGKGTVVTLRF